MYFPNSFKYSWTAFYSLLALSVILFCASIFYSCGKNDYSSNSNYTTMPTPTAGANDIFIQGMAFVSGNKTISVGTTLKWTNLDGIAHTVTSGVPGAPSGVFDSGNINPQGSFSFTFSQAGVFKYFCKIHNSMTATITVQ